MTEPDYITVTAAVLKKDGKVLIARRKRPFMGYEWEFPGGKLEDNETLEECLKRELKEELGIEIKVGRLICSTRHVLNCQSAIILYAYEASFVSGEFCLKDHEEVRWIKTSELEQYSFPDPDRHITRILTEEIEHD